MSNFRNRYLFFLDIVLLLLTPAAAYALRVDAEAWVSQEYVRGLLVYTVVSLLIKIPTFYIAGLYRHYWRYASIDELYLILITVIGTTAACTTVYLIIQNTHVLPGVGLPRAVPVLDGMLTLLVVGGLRFSVRALAYMQSQRGRDKSISGTHKRALVVGAGDAGTMILRELRNNPRVEVEPIGFIDDDPSKQGINIAGVSVLGMRKDLPKLVRDYDVREVIIAMPTASGKVIREIVAMCEAAQVASKTVPGIYDLLSNRSRADMLRNVDIEDLLRREPVQTDVSGVARMIAGARVLVTGAGGSIGSELCRQIMRAGPARLIILGHGENSLFSINNELLKLRARSNIELVAVVADVRDRNRLDSVFQHWRPQLVFHAAAHKHVPLMEDNVPDAVTNNVLGTRNLLEMAEAHGVERFVMISTDKAVNPTNVMGATKRIGELLVQQAGQRTGRPYVAVRFGNVLGSRGSVVPFFRQQIAEGGPVTVTHPDITRYFMTIPEAVQLVLQAGTLGQPSDVYVLDMGEPVRIVDLATDLIELSGLKVGRDIDIEFVGLRPGEKLHEELFANRETQTRTSHQKIFRVSDQLPTNAADAQRLADNIQHLIDLAQAGQALEARQWIKVIVPEYQPSTLTGTN